MIVGFNHNMTYRGVCFHVQTEDSGVKTPHLITLLYHGGTIISSQKTSYADILKVDNLETVIEDLAKEQHKGMLRRLKKGEFDQRIIDYGIKITTEAPKEESAGAAKAEGVDAGVAESMDVPTEIKEEQVEVKPEIEFLEPAEVVATEASAPSADESRAPKLESTDLDDLIFSYLSGDDENE